MRYVCSACGRRTPQSELRVDCTCGGVLTLPAATGFDRASVDESEDGVWRYASALPHVPVEHRVRLGERRTPLVAAVIDGRTAWLKAEHLLPTGSYKDRGSAVVVSLLKSIGVRGVMDDSSGNAGASLSAYATAAGMDCVIYAPAGNSSGKLLQIQAYGARLRRVPGDRQAAMAIALQEAGGPLFYASHNRYPGFLAGVATLGFELWEDMGHQAPGSVIVPAGNGSLVLGLSYAFNSLLASGAIPRVPPIYAVQASARPALAAAFASGADDVEAVDRGETVAEGIAAIKPTRGRELIEAIRASEGAALTVTEPEIIDALRIAGRAGHYLEPTSAVAVAGYRRLLRENVVDGANAVVVLSGHGLKSSWPETFGAEESQRIEWAVSS